VAPSALLDRNSRADSRGGSAQPAIQTRLPAEARLARRFRENVDVELRQPTVQALAVA
jgi:hypothetical protein